MIGYVRIIATAKAMLTEGEVAEIKSILASKDNYELVMLRQGIIQVADDIEYHFGCFGVDYFFFALDNEIRKRNYYNLKECKFFDCVDAALYKYKVEEYQLAQRKKYEMQFWKQFADYLARNK